MSILWRKSAVIKWFSTAPVPDTKVVGQDLGLKKTSHSQMWKEHKLPHFPGGCCNIGPHFKLKFHETPLPRTYTVTKLFWNFAQSMAVILPCSVQTFKTVGQKKFMLWTNFVTFESDSSFGEIFHNATSLRPPQVTAPPHGCSHHGAPSLLIMEAQPPPPLSDQFGNCWHE